MNASDTPVYDWQFWVVTTAAILAAAWLLRGLLPIPVLSKRHKRRKSEHRAVLTVKGKSVR